MMGKRQRKLDGGWHPDHPLDPGLSTAKLFVWGAGVALGLFLAGFQIRKISAGGVLTLLDRELLVEGALILYVNAWIWAQPLEMGMTRRVYHTDPYKGRTPRSLMILLPLLVMCGGALFFTRHHDRYLSWALVAFFFADFSVWRNFAQLAKKYQRANEQVYESQHSFWRLEQLRAYAQRYMQGNWQLIRFSTLLAILVVFVVLANVPSITSRLAVLILPALKEGNAEHVAGLLPVLVFFLYVLVCKAWSWSMRLRAYHTLAVVEQLAPTYELHPRVSAKEVTGPMAAADRRTPLTPAAPSRA
jgi:hypothetical protein